MIHFHLTDSINYKQVETQILDAIKKHLPADSWTESPSYKYGSMNFTLFIHSKAEVLLPHGCADKNYFFRRTDFNKKAYINNASSRKHLIVPGEFLKERIKAFSGLKFDDSNVHIGGWPRLDYLNSIPRTNKSKKTKILFAPTHNYIKSKESDNSMSSYPAFMPFIDKLSEKYDVEVSLHPRNRKSKRPTDNALIDSDIVISDFGTLVYEAVALNKHVIYPSWLIRDEILRRKNKDCQEYAIFADKIGHHAESFEHMLELLDQLSNTKPEIDPLFKKFLEPSLFKSSSKKTANILLELSKNPDNTSPVKPFRQLRKSGLRVHPTIDTRGKEIDILFEPPAQINNATAYIYRSFKIGRYSYIRSGYINNVRSIGRYTSIGPNVIIGESEHPTTWLSTSPVQYSRSQFTFYPQEKLLIKDRIIARTEDVDTSPRGNVIIANDVWIGANAIIRRGVKIGNGAIIAAGSVVNEDVQPYSIVGGIPAKLVKMRFPPKIIVDLLTLKWWAFDINDLSGIDFSDVQNAIKQIKLLEEEGKISRKVMAYKKATISSQKGLVGFSDIS